MHFYRLYAIALFLIGISAPVSVQAGVGDACTVANRIHTSEGPTTDVLICDGATMTLQTARSLKGNPIREGIRTGSPEATLHVDGEAIIGNTGLTCSATTEGALRYNSTDKNIEMCNGTEWMDIVASSATGSPSTPDPGSGYFVITSGTWTGDLGTAAGGGLYGYAAADKLCLDDLTANSWMGKGSATVDDAHIEPFICASDGAVFCVDALPSTTYYFAVSGDATKGGASFTTNASGIGPNNTQNWSGTNYFDGVKTYWSGRQQSAPNNAWVDSHIAGGSGAQCLGATKSWTGTSGATAIGNTNSTDWNRWAAPSQVCSATRHLVCFVHP